MVKNEVIYTSSYNLIRRIVRICVISLLYSLLNPYLIIGQDISHKKEIYGLFVGISNYKEIDSLYYASSDAMYLYNYFSQYLGVKTNQLKLLQDEQATKGHITILLDSLLKKSKPGDQVYFYFAGHGDEDIEPVSNPDDKDRIHPVLLLADAPTKNYLLNKPNEVIEFERLRKWIKAFTDKGVKFIFIADACRSGNLIGGQLGRRRTEWALMQNWAGEIKILSCQPGEVSAEGPGWGGGHGAFTYYLVEGLMGLADGATREPGGLDNQVKLFELQRYIQDNVRRDLRPYTEQTPIIIADNLNSTIVTVHPDSVQKLISRKKQRLPLFSSIQLKGLKQLSPLIDSAVARLYEQFVKALQEKRLVKPEGQCAWFYYQQLRKSTLPDDYLRLAHRNLLAGLYDETVGKAGDGYELSRGKLLDLNKILRRKSSGYETASLIDQLLSGGDSLSFWNQQRGVISKALSLLSADTTHLLWPSLRSYQFLVEARAMGSKGYSFNKDSLQWYILDQKKKALRSFQYYPNACAKILLAIIELRSDTSDSAKLHAIDSYLELVPRDDLGLILKLGLLSKMGEDETAIALSKALVKSNTGGTLSWFYNGILGEFYSEDLDSLTLAINTLNRSFFELRSVSGTYNNKQINDFSSALFASMAKIYEKGEKVDSANYYYKESIALNPLSSTFEDWYRVYSSKSEVKAQAKAIEICQLAIRSLKNRNDKALFYNLHGNILYEQGKYVNAVDLYKKAVKLDTTKSSVYNRNLINALAKAGRFIEAKVFWQVGLKEAQTSFDKATYHVQAAKIKLNGAAPEIVLFHYRQANELDPTNDWWGYLDEESISMYSDSLKIELYEEIIQKLKDPSNLTFFHIKLADFYKSQGRFVPAFSHYESAETSYKEAVRKSWRNMYPPGFSPREKFKNVMFEFLDSLKNGKDQQRLLKLSFELLQVLKDSTHKAFINNAIGLIYSQRRDYPLSSQYYHQAVNLKLTDETYWSNLAGSYSDQDRPDDALHIYRQAINVLADSNKKAEFLNQCGNIEFSRKRYVEALKEYELAIAFAANEPVYWENLSNGYTKLGQYKQAISKLEAALLQQTDTIRWVRLAICLRTQFYNLMSLSLTPDSTLTASYEYYDKESLKRLLKWASLTEPTARASINEHEPWRGREACDIFQQAVNQFKSFSASGQKELENWLFKFLIIKAAASINYSTKVLDTRKAISCLEEAILYGANLKLIDEDSILNVLRETHQYKSWRQTR